MPLTITNHPLVSHKMTILRNLKTNPSDFRKILKEISFYLGYEASRNLNTSAVTVKTPMDANFDGHKISDKIAIIPILRAGLGMAEALLELIPIAEVHHIGMYRSKDSLIPIQYYNKLPKHAICDHAFVCDPCIATSATINAVVNQLKRWGARKITVIAAIASRSGIDNLLSAHPDVEVFIAEVDELLSEDGMIIPGIGDAGDRQFNTSDEITGEEAEDGSKRKRET